jgi:hypothetical protein
MNSSASGYSRSSWAADAEQGDHPLTGLQCDAVNSVGPAGRAGKPLRGRGVPDDLLAGNRDVGV